MNKLPDTTFTINNATEAVWIVDKLKEVYKGQTVLNCLPTSAYDTAGFIYTTRNYSHTAKNDLQIEWNKKTSYNGLGCYPNNKSYKVSDLMLPLQDGAYQIEQTIGGKEWLDFLLLKFLLQGVINLKEYNQMKSAVIAQLYKHSHVWGYSSSEYLNTGLPSMYQRSSAETSRSTIEFTNLGETPLGKFNSSPQEINSCLNTKYLAKIGCTYVEVSVISTNPNNPDLLRVVDLAGVRFYWVYKRDLYSNTLGDSK